MIFLPGPGYDAKQALASEKRIPGRGFFLMNPSV